MGKLRAIAAAQAVPQIDTITLGGSWTAGETATIEVGEKSVTYTVESGDTSDSVASGLQGLAASSDDSEFTESTWTVDGSVVTSTSDDGMPITIAVSESSASGTIVLANTQQATGPYHWDNPSNWTTGAVPVSNDEVYIDDLSVEMLYGLPTGLTLNRLVIERGKLGLLDHNGAYPEYRAKRAVIDCADVVIGEANQSGPSVVRLDLGSAASEVAVFGSSANSGQSAVDIVCNNASTNVSVISGQVGIAENGEDTATLGVVRVGQGSMVTIGSGANVTTVVSRGETVQQSDVANVTVDEGSYTIKDSAAITNLDVRGGNFIHLSSGTITDAVVGPGQLDVSRDLRTKTITDLSLNLNGRIFDPVSVLTVTNGIQKGTDANTILAQ